MRIIDINIKDLKPYENNPRTNNNAVNPVAKSIEEFGFKVPLVVDKDNVIVAGHTRYKAAKKLKLETVPCIVADDLTEEQIRAFRLADNKTGEIATWDLDLLNIELDNILDIDMSLFDFSFTDEKEIIINTEKNGFNNNFENTDYINELLKDDFVNLNPNKEIFNITFTFPIELKDEINTYIKNNGKEKIINIIVKEVTTCHNAEAK